MFDKKKFVQQSCDQFPTLWNYWLAQIGAKPQLKASLHNDILSPMSKVWD